MKRLILEATVARTAGIGGVAVTPMVASNFAAALSLLLALSLASNTAAQWNAQDVTSALERRRSVLKY